MESDAIVEQLVPDPAEIPDVTVIVGYLGRSARKGHWRVYRDPGFSEYVDVPEEAVVHSQQLPREASALGGTVVWAKRDANLRRVRTSSREAQADFLQGTIQARAARRRPALDRLVASLRPVAFDPSFHFWSICDELAAPSFLSGGDVFCGGSQRSWDAECP